MNRSADVTLTEEDYVAAQRLHLRGQLRSAPTLWRIARVVLACAVILAVFLFALGLWDVSPLLVVALAILGPLLGAGIGIGLQLLLEPRRARRVFRQQKSLHAPIAFSWSETGLRSRTERGQGEFPWDHYWGWREDATMLLLYHSERLYQFIPKRALSPGQAADLAGFLAAAAVATGRP